MAPEYDDDLVVRAIVAAKRRLTELKFEAMLRFGEPRPSIHDIDALVDEVVAGLGQHQPTDRGQSTVQVEPARP